MFQWSKANREIILINRKKKKEKKPYAFMSLKSHKTTVYRLGHTMRKNLPKTLDQLIFCKYTLNALKFTKYLVNVHKFTKSLVNSYHQKGTKHYVLTN